MKVTTFGIILLLLVPAALSAQTSGPALTGTVTAPAGTPIASAKVSARDVATGKLTETETNSAGVYHFENLPPAEYEVSVTALGFASNTVKVVLASGQPQKVDIALGMAANPSGPSLSDLGFPSAQTQANPEEQARLDKRSHMLKIHQKMGLITAAPLLATIIVGFNAGGTQTGSGTRDLHAALGTTTAGLYFTTAYFAIFAPRISGTQTRGPIRVHKALAWIHGPGMILTPILGEMAFSQKSKGEKVHGIASLHGPVAIITGAAYGAALLSVSVKF
jgi:hypothetical protein